MPNGRELAQLLEQMAEAGAADAFGDPLEWQRNERTDNLADQWREFFATTKPFPDDFLANREDEPPQKRD